MNMNIESKSYPLTTRIKDKSHGIVHAVVAVFGNVDEHGDVVCPGAFRKCIEHGKARGKLPPGVFYHDWSQPVAKTLDAWESEDGLHVVGQFNLETQRGRETFSDIKAGIITEYSFGFRTLRGEKKGDVRHILEVDWYEWSPVLMGANRETRTVGVKGLGEGFSALSRSLESLVQKAGRCLCSSTFVDLKELRGLRDALDLSLNEMDCVLRNSCGDSPALSSGFLECQRELLCHLVSIDKLLTEGE
jgi:hypothetical protein